MPQWLLNRPFVLCLFFCTSIIPVNARQNMPLKIFAGIPPVAYLAEKIGGEQVDVHVLVERGQDPHTYEPRPRQIAELSSADIYFAIGLPLESRIVERIGKRDNQLSIIDISEGIPKRFVAAHDHHEHHETDEDSHKTNGMEADPHIWLSPPLLEIQAKNLTDALKQADPQHCDLYESNLRAFQQKIHELHERNSKLLEPYKGRTFYSFHPAFGYFGEAYGLIEKTVEIEGKSPSPKQLAELIQDAKRDRVKVIYLQPQFDPTSAATVARAIGGQTAMIDPLEKDLFKNLAAIAEVLNVGFAAQDGNQMQKEDNSVHRGN